MQVKQFEETQKFRVIIDNASFYATAQQIRNGIGALGPCNAATMSALAALEQTRSGDGAAEFAACGIAGRWEELNVQLDVA